MITSQYVSSGGSSMNRDYALLSSIRKFDIVPGKKALQKINYFANLKTDLFMYEWRNWGPFSQEIQQFYDDAFLEDVISVHEKPLANSAIQYNIELDEKGSQILGRLEQKQELNKDSIDDSINFAYGLLKEKTPRQMEILASVHYIYSYDNSMPAKRIWEIINKLKPAANFKQSDVEYALNELRAKQLI